jgi:hypothetical protein
MLTVQHTEDNFEFRDLNNNGQLEPYEDSRLPVETRVTDLLSRMTVAEKAGLMFQTFATFVRGMAAPHCWLAISVNQRRGRWC